MCDVSVNVGQCKWEEEEEDERRKHLANFPGIAAADARPVVRPNLP